MFDAITVGLDIEDLIKVYWEVSAHFSPSGKSMNQESCESEQI